NPVTGKWHKLLEKLPEQERSNQHQHCYWQWRNLQQSLQAKSRNKSSQKQRALLERLLDATLFLASRNMAFKGSSSKIGYAYSGNFLGVLELISHYDLLLHDHLAKVKESQKKGEKMQAHYLSWESQNKFIELCGQHVLNTILTERNEAIYFSIICDATPDISHTEQNVLIVRYVHKDKDIIKSNKVSNEAMSEAKGLKKRNLLLQSAGVSLDTEAANIANLQEEMNEWNAIISEARMVANLMEVVPEFKSKINRKIKRKRFHNESPDEATSERAETIFWNTVFYVAMDNIISELNHRFQSVRDICNDFAPVLKFKNMNADEIITSCKKLANKYSQDLTSGLASEVQHLKKIYNATFQSNLKLLDLLNAIYKMKLETIFGEICIAIRIFCTLPVTVAEGERAFSKLSIIKNYLRSTMSQDRLSSLAILSTEYELARKIDFRDIIRDFANKKAQQCVL
uniref:HAT C-terminal dimerisation domain-containing protein n=1 Tax=Latimeria chalumnae TaxID=7897 RepID=H3BBS4_LATCH